jgi:hypothetical protein
MRTPMWRASFPRMLTHLRADDLIDDRGWVETELDQMPSPVCDGRCAVPTAIAGIYGMSSCGSSNGATGIFSSLA